MSPTDNSNSKVYVIPEEVKQAAAMLIRACSKHGMLLTGVICKNEPLGIMYVTTYPSDEPAKLMRAAANLLEGKTFQDEEAAKIITEANRGNTQLN